ncbi:hypothetical protein GGE45_000414 [Rhizobium aethiopicum]|uniref:Uncharacterized protein n=1 Tax=Rhizobium aethiopicum TaxID=1138170 RepID=A0A7W6ME76_9HYPH|nr:hypothetical protein [Rhizobium aethiopicum]MBB4578120.1 hypothetical protein [Rhizobium aethiopicum]
MRKPAAASSASAALASRLVAIISIEGLPVTAGLLFIRRWLLLAQCKVEGLQLAIVDRLLVDHPLALRL